MKKILNISGSRKKSTARATIKEGTGKITINKIPLESIQPTLTKLRMQEPLIIANDYATKVDINIKVTGGGSQGQTEATRLAIAKAIYTFSNKNPQLRKDFIDYDRQLLVADTRRNEPHKPNDSKPRAKRQFSKR